MCDPAVKARHAQEAGAIALAVINTWEIGINTGYKIPSSSDVTIPLVDIIDKHNKLAPYFSQSGNTAESFLSPGTLLRQLHTLKLNKTSILSTIKALRTLVPSFSAFLL